MTAGPATRPATPAAYWLSFLTPVAVVAGARLGGAATLLAVALVFVVLPVLDESIGIDTAERRSGSRWASDLPLTGWVVVGIATTAATVVAAARGAFSAAELAGLAVSLGVMNGSGGITVAHELMHRRSRAARAAAEALMTLVGYPHFCVEHVFGHHRNVATPADPATSRLGESAFAFVARSVAGGVRSAWRIEAERARRARLRRLDPRDGRLRWPLGVGACLAGTAWLGPAGVALFVGQAVVAVGLLEVINYLEHYGLLRRELAPGRYAAVGPEHSWNSSHRISNWYLFNLARHSDHHYLASRPYPDLRHWDTAPQLPCGYATMLLVALVPPLWFRTMDPRVRAWRDRFLASRVTRQQGVADESRSA